MGSQRAKYRGHHDRTGCNIESWPRLDVITLLTPAIAFNPRSSSSHIGSAASTGTTGDEKDAINRPMGIIARVAKSSA